MQFYILLTGFTAIFALLCFFLYRKTRALSFIAGLLIVYYFSIFGAWVIVYDQSGGDSGFRYYYLLDKLADVRLDGSYFYSLLLYALFILVLQLTLLFTVKGGRLPADSGGPPLVVSHWMIISLSAAFAFTGYSLVSEKLKIAFLDDISAYIITRGLGSEAAPLYFSLHQLMNRLAVLPLMIGFSVFLAGRNARYIRGRFSWFLLIVYPALILAIFSYILSLGNKNELLLSILAAFLFYIVNARRVSTGMIAAAGAFSYLVLALVDALRAYPLSGAFSLLGDSRFVEEALADLARSNEAFGAHFSMYAAVFERLDLTWGSSLLSLIASVVPRFLWADRPEDIYQYYSEGIRAAEGQGYSIHHATGWYLNFGAAGVVAGALCLGLVWASLHNSFVSGPVSGRFRRTLQVLGPTLIVAGLPSLIRSGPEGYKGLLFDAFIPAILITGLTVKREFTGSS